LKYHMMKWFKKYLQRTKTNSKGFKGYLPNTLLASLNLIGPIGSFFAGAVGSFWTKRRFENIEYVMQIMGEKLQSIDTSEIKEYMCSEEYIQLFLSAMQKAQIEHQEEKRRSYGLMLANMVVDRKTEYDQKSMFISLLSEIEILHLRTLGYLQGMSQNEEDEKRWASIKEVKSANSDLAKNSDYVVVAVLQKLANSGLIKSKGKDNGKIMIGINPVGLWFHSLFTITDLGQRFLEFLKE